MAFHQVVRVVAVWDSLVAAAGAVLVVFRMAAAVVSRRTLSGVGRVDRQGVFLGLAVLHVVQVAVVEIVDVTVVLDGRVAATGAVLMCVTGVRGRSRTHQMFLSRKGRCFQTTVSEVPLLLLLVSSARRSNPPGIRRFFLKTDHGSPTVSITRTSAAPPIMTARAERRRALPTPGTKQRMPTYKRNEIVVMEKLGGK